MSEHQEIIDAMMALAATDEGDRVTSDDLDQCETAALTIQDLEAELSALRNSVRQKSVRATEQQLRETREALITHGEHRAYCALAMSPSGRASCDCGLDKAIGEPTQ